MEHIGLERTPLKSAPWLHLELVTACLQFNMVAGVQPVLQHQRPLTSMESLQLAVLMAKVDLGRTKFIVWLIADLLLALDELFATRVYTSP